MGDVAETLDRVVDALPGGGERREGQRTMAEAVARALDQGGRVVVQAGTGTGKTMAYLIPAILSGRKVVVATATKALQDQLAGKDLPFLASHVGRRVQFAVLKGRSNYLCRQRAREVAGDGDGESDQLELDGVAVDATATGREVRRLLEWAQQSPTGDRAELDFEPSPRAWGALSVSAMECPGAAHCPAGLDCFAEAARQRAEAADVVVVNTHLYGAHLASGGRVLPPHDVVVFDEAHELEDIASATLGLEIAAGRFRALARGMRRLVAEEERPVVDDLEAMGDVFEQALEPYVDSRLTGDAADELATILDFAAERVRRAVAALRQAQTDDPAKARWLQAGGHLAGDLAFVRAATAADVVWVEAPNATPVLHIAPVDVGAVLVEKLWSAPPADEDDAEAQTLAAVLTSATIPLNLPSRLGLSPDDVEVLDVGSPFDFASHAVLYCAAHLPDPRHPDYEAAMHDELEALIRAAGGRTLALFTSWRAMRAAADAVAGRVPYRVLTQAELPKPALVRAFTDEAETCLFATMGFWQGVDVPGPSLSLVTIDRIPFPRPGEPLLDARRERAGPAAFRAVDLPRAAILLAQGAGRLIRTTVDRGAVAVLDPRLARAGYRWDLVNALPPMRRTRDRGEVEAFLRGC